MPTRCAATGAAANAIDAAARAKMSFPDIITPPFMVFWIWEIDLHGGAAGWPVSTHRALARLDLEGRAGAGEPHLALLDGAVEAHGAPGERAHGRDRLARQVDHGGIADARERLAVLGPPE